MKWMLLTLNLIIGSTLASAQTSSGIDGAFQKLKSEALMQSYEIRIAREGAQQATFGKLTSWTRWMPKLDLDLSQTRSRDYSILTGGSLGNLSSALSLTPQIISLSRWDLSLTFPIYNRSIYLGVKQATADQVLAEDRLRLKEGELDWRLRSLLGNYLTQKYKVATLQTSIQIAEQNLRESTLRFEMGERTKIDVIRSKANLLALQSKKLAYQQEKMTGLSEFLEYSGLTLSQLEKAGFDLTSEEGLLGLINEFTKTDQILFQLKSILEENNSNILLEKSIVNSSPVYVSLLSEEESSIRKAENLSAQEWPQFSFRGGLNQQSNHWSNVLSTGNISYSAALTLKIAIFSGGSFFSTRKEQAHLVATSRLKAEKDILRLKNEVERDRNQIRLLMATLEAQKMNLEQNEELVRLSFKSYQLGKVTLVELLTAQNDLIDSKINHVKSKQEFSTLLRKFAWNMGVSIP